MSDKFYVNPSCDAWAVKESGGYHWTPRVLLFNNQDDAEAVAAVLNQRHPPSELRFSEEKQ